MILQENSHRKQAIPQALLPSIRTTMKTTARMRILPRITTVLKQITVRMILQENSHRKQAIPQALLPSMRWQEVRWLALEQ